MIRRGEQDRICRVERLLGILNHIEKGQATHQRLAEIFGVCERTIYRDMRILMSCYPVYYDQERGRYRFTEGYSLKAINLSFGEIRALHYAWSIISMQGGELAEAYERVIRKLKVETGETTQMRLEKAFSPAEEEMTT